MRIARPLALAALAFALFAKPALAASGEAAPKASSEPAVQQVEAAKVCMVTDRLFDKDQIPVEVEGRTYFGCCAMCKERLAVEAGLRTAVDPVSGKNVDKAKAVLGVRPDGSVLYFESEKNLEAFSKGSES